MDVTAKQPFIRTPGIQQTKNWVAPPLCGCELLITAEWTDEPTRGDGKRYQHPTGRTITAIEIVTVCPVHEAMITDAARFAVQTATLFGDVKLAIKMAGTDMALNQRQGYLNYPIANPTDAEVLYTLLWFYGTQTQTLACGCVLAACHHKILGQIAYYDHPLHAEKCECHVSDTADGKQACAEHVAPADVATAIMAAHPELEQWRLIGTEEWKPLADIPGDEIMRSYLNEKRGLGPTFETAWLFAVGYDDARTLHVAIDPSVNIDVSKAIASVKTPVPVKAITS